MQAHIAEAVRNRERFSGELRELGLSPLPSAANFLLIPIEGAANVGAAMRRRGVAVRPMPDLPVVGDALRISIGPWSMMEVALAALREGIACA